PMTTDAKPNRLKARLPRGLSDSGAAEVMASRHLIERLREVYELYGFEPVETPAIEYTDALGKFLPDLDRPNEGVFSFKDDGEAHAGKRLTVLRAIDKLDRLGTGGVRALLGEGRKDESGDFTRGAGLEPLAIDRVIGFTAAGGATNAATLANLETVVAGSRQG